MSLSIGSAGFGKNFVLWAKAEGSVAGEENSDVSDAANPKAIRHYAKLVTRALRGKDARTQYIKLLQLAGTLREGNVTANARQAYFHQLVLAAGRIDLDYYRAKSCVEIAAQWVAARGQNPESNPAETQEIAQTLVSAARVFYAIGNAYQSADGLVFLAQKMADVKAKKSRVEKVLADALCRAGQITNPLQKAQVLAAAAEVQIAINSEPSVINDTLKAARHALKLASDSTDHGNPAVSLCRLNIVRLQWEVDDVQPAPEPAPAPQGWEGWQIETH